MISEETPLMGCSTYHLDNDPLHTKGCGPNLEGPKKGRVRKSAHLGPLGQYPAHHTLEPWRRWSLHKDAAAPSWHYWKAMGLFVIRQSSLTGILGEVVEMLLGQNYHSSLCQPSMTGASRMLMRGETPSYTPNFSTPPFWTSKAFRFYHVEYSENNWWRNQNHAETVSDAWIDCPSVEGRMSSFL